MIELAHGNTPLHDDPSVVNMLMGFGGIGGTLSFLWFFLRNL